MGTKWAIIIDLIPAMLPTKFPFIWPSGLREDLLEIDQPEIRFAHAGHVC